MTDYCTRLSDRMPAVARGAGRWAPDDEAHLASCAACAAEWDVVRAGARLGRAVERSLDPGAIAAGVQAGLRDAPRRGARVPLRWVVPLAAAAALFLAVWAGRGGTGGDAPAAEVYLLPELEALSSTELESVLELIAPAGADGADLRGFEDLTEEELRALLQELGG